MITDLIQKMIDRADLTEQEARDAMQEIMAGQATDAQIAGFLTALRMKGETAQELIGFAAPSKIPGSGFCLRSDFIPR